VIRHRFILRGEDDFRIFAAIPVEHTVLTWKKWVRPPDWKALRSLLIRMEVAEENTRAMYTAIREGLEELQDATEPDAYLVAGSVVERSVPRSRIDQFVADNTSQIEQAKEEEDKLSKAVAARQRFVAFIDAGQLPPDAWTLATESTPASCRNGDGHCDLLDAFYDSLSKSVVDCRLFAIEADSANAPGWARSARTQHRVLAGVCARIQTTNFLRAQYKVCLEDALALAFAGSPTCPEGIPFAAYTVEFHNVIVDVVEGCAWLREETVEAVKQKITRVLDKVPAEVSLQALEQVRGKLEEAPIEKHTLTDEEKRVVEIVTQMLTERALNPKADTRIPVVSIDPAHEHRTRAAEDKDKQAPSNETRLRTIKFQVSPPRYLRTAAQRILASTKRAHWVVGHWRDQPYGTAHQLRRRTWIKPHIRGLGEAGAITARIAAPDEKTGDRPK
jgi:hypothetical protein